MPAPALRCIPGPPRRSRRCRTCLPRGANGSKVGTPRPGMARQLPLGSPALTSAGRTCNLGRYQMDDPTRYPNQDEPNDPDLGDGTAPDNEEHAGEAIGGAGGAVGGAVVGGAVGGP